MLTEATCLCAKCGKTLNEKYDKDYCIPFCSEKCYRAWWIQNIREGSEPDEK